MADRRPAAAFVTCPGCGRWMLGQIKGRAVYPQPHVCVERADQLNPKEDTDG